MPPPGRWPTDVTQDTRCKLHAPGFRRQAATAKPLLTTHYSLLTRLAQSTLEYAVFVAVVASALAAMSLYVRRSIQANLKQLEDQVNAGVPPP